MKKYKIVYQLKDGTVGYSYCSKGVKAEMEAIKYLAEIQNNPVVEITYTRLG